jgi:hypothetical protein
MESGGIPLTVSTESLGSSAFQVNQSLGTPIEQSQSTFVEGPQHQTDSVTISSQALELSNQPRGHNAK